MKESRELSDTQQLTLQIKRLIRSQNMSNSFVRGISWSLGNIVGTTIVVAVILWILSQLPLIPIIGSWLAEIIASAQQKLFLNR